MNDLRRFDFAQVMRDLKRAKDRAELRAERAEAALDRIFRAESVDELYERVEEAECVVGGEARA